MRANLPSRSLDMDIYSVSNSGGRHMRAARLPPAKPLRELTKVSTKTLPRRRLVRSPHRHRHQATYATPRLPCILRLYDTQATHLALLTKCLSGSRQHDDRQWREYQPGIAKHPLDECRGKQRTALLCGRSRCHRRRVRPRGLLRGPVDQHRRARHLHHCPGFLRHPYIHDGDYSDVPSLQRVGWLMQNYFPTTALAGAAFQPAIWHIVTDKGDGFGTPTTVPGLASQSTDPAHPTDPDVVAAAVQ